MKPARASIDAPTEYFILTGFPRSAFNLPPHQKPGDIDILIVPTRGERIFAEASIAIEVKALRLPAYKRHKDTASSGLAQVTGLIRDGFPFVGLLHVIVPEPSPVSEWRPMMLAKVIDDFGRVEILSENELVDPVVGDSTVRQSGRILKLVSGTCIGAQAVCLAVSKDGFKIVGESVHPGKHAEKNPQADDRLIARIADVVRAFMRWGHVPIIG